MNMITSGMITSDMIKDPVAWCPSCRAGACGVHVKPAPEPEPEIDHDQCDRDEHLRRRESGEDCAS